MYIVRTYVTYICKYIYAHHGHILLHSHLNRLYPVGLLTWQSQGLSSIRRCVLCVAIDRFVGQDVVRGWEEEQGFAVVCSELWRGGYCVAKQGMDEGAAARTSVPKRIQLQWGRAVTNSQTSVPSHFNVTNSQTSVPSHFYVTDSQNVSVLVYLPVNVTVQSLNFKILYR